MNTQTKLKEALELEKNATITLNELVSNKGFGYAVDKGINEITNKYNLDTELATTYHFGWLNEYVNKFPLKSHIYTQRYTNVIFFALQYLDYVWEVKGFEYVKSNTEQILQSSNFDINEDIIKDVAYKFITKLKYYEENKATSIAYEGVYRDTQTLSNYSQIEGLVLAYYNGSKLLKGLDSSLTEQQLKSATDLFMLQNPITDEDAYEVIPNYMQYCVEEERFERIEDNNEVFPKLDFGFIDGEYEYEVETTAFCKIDELPKVENITNAIDAEYPQFTNQTIKGKVNVKNGLLQIWELGDIFGEDFGEWNSHSFIESIELTEDNKITSYLGS
jgi:hypothetical protein